MRLIDADAMIKDCTAITKNECTRKAAPRSWAFAYEQFIEDLEDAQTVDAVEVVRCNDCKHSWRHPCGYIHCRRSGLVDHDMTFSPYDFCSYGERRSDNASD